MGRTGKEEEVNPPAGISGVIGAIRGEDDAETKQLEEMAEAARRYLGSQKWCRAVRRLLFGLGVGGVAAVFLAQIDAESSVDEWLWVVVGDLPSAYLVVDEAKSPEAALESYCDLMAEWADAVLGSQDLGEVFPVEAPADRKHAAMLVTRIALLRDVVLPGLRGRVSS